MPRCRLIADEVGASPRIDKCIVFHRQALLWRQRIILFKGIVDAKAPLAKELWGTTEFAIVDPDRKLITFVKCVP